MKAIGKRMNRNPLWFLGDNQIAAWLARVLCHVFDVHTTHCRGHADCREAKRWMRPAAGPGTTGGDHG